MIHYADPPHWDCSMTELWDRDGIYLCQLSLKADGMKKKRKLAVFLVPLYGCKLIVAVPDLNLLCYCSHGAPPSFAGVSSGFSSAIAATMKIVKTIVNAYAYCDRDQVNYAEVDSSFLVFGGCDVTFLNCHQELRSPQVTEESF